ncbi:MAG TPA: S8 family serine peptidase [Tepidisphaeraceae bacterium]|jgi:hypothetical protein|nr:S8 family serine peptidase [Tepidisphaeraceae bacterium]
MRHPDVRKAVFLRTLLAGAACAALVAIVGQTPLRASTLDTIGITQLRALNPALTGAGISVAQAEAPQDSNAFEVNPAATGQSAALFTYISSVGTSTVFGDSVGIESSHANSVAGNFYAAGTGAAPGVQHVYNYEAGYFSTLIINDNPINGSIVNQSFAFTAGTQQSYDSAYDNYTYAHGTLFVSAVGNAVRPSAPGTSYNGIGVAAYGGTSAAGPTLDNGRSKPDITAPGDFTSFSTPLVSGVAAILSQAGAQGDGGSGTASVATDPRVIKTLLINGAVKPSDWTHTPTAPLDTRYGGGIVNAYNSYILLAAGEHTFSSSNATGSLVGTAPANITGTADPLFGWDRADITSGTLSDAVNHYVFNPKVAAGVTSYTLTATLTWYRQTDQAAINNLNLFLYDATTSTTTAVDESASLVDNVEHLYTLSLTPGHTYDLQVLKDGGLAGSTTVSNLETYALAYSFTPLPEPASLAVMLLGIPMFCRRSSRRALPSRD